MRIVLVLLVVLAAAAGVRLLASQHHEKGAFQTVAETERYGLLLHAGVVGSHGVVTVRATVTNRGARTARLVAGRCGRVTSAALRAGGAGRRELRPAGARRCGSTRTVALRPGATVDESWELPAGPRLSRPGAHFEVRVAEPGGRAVSVDAPASADPGASARADAPPAKTEPVALAARSSLTHLYCRRHDPSAGDAGRGAAAGPGDGDSEQ